MAALPAVFRLQHFDTSFFYVIIAITGWPQIMYGNGKISETVYKYVHVCYLLPTDYKLIF